MSYRGAVVGLGNIAIKGHLPIYSELYPQVEIVAGVDKCEPNLAAFRQLFPEADTYTDYRDLLCDHRLDFIDICTPPAYHAEIIAAAAGSKVNILCEKPLATSNSDMQKILEAVEQNNVKLVPCHQYRYSKQWKLTEELINSGKIGQPKRFEVQVLRSYPNLGNPYWKPDWRILKEESGGGIVLDHGSHLFYLARQLLGEPHSLLAKMDTLVHNHTGLEDTAWIKIEHEKGAAELDLTWASDRRHTSQRIIGDKGEINISEGKLTWRVNGKENIVDLTEGFSKNSAHTPWYTGLIGNFMDMLACEKQDSFWLDEAQSVLQCSLLAYESARLGQAVDFCRHSKRNGVK